MFGSAMFVGTTAPGIFTVPPGGLGYGAVAAPERVAGDDDQSGPDRRDGFGVRDRARGGESHHRQWRGRAFESLELRGEHDYGRHQRSHCDGDFCGPGAGTGRAVPGERDNAKRTHRGRQLSGSGRSGGLEAEAANSSGKEVG